MNSNNNRSSYRFPFWLTVIFLLLVLVPVTLYMGQFQVAKISGVLCLLVVLAALKFWFKTARLNAGVNERVILTRNDWFEIERHFPFVRKWDQADISVLKDRIGVILANVELRKNKTELADRNQAIQMAFQWCVLNWSNPSMFNQNSFLYKGDNDSIVMCERSTNKEQVFLIGIGMVSNSVLALESHYQGLNPSLDLNE